MHALPNTSAGQLLICPSCHTVEYLEAPVEPLMQAAGAEGFKVERVHLELLWLCRVCQ